MTARKKSLVFLFVFLITAVVFLFSSRFILAGDNEVVINEFLVEPASEQWVELYNKGSEAVDIGGWFIDDDGSTQKYTIPSGTIIQVGEFKSFQSGLLNFDRTNPDTVRLIKNSVVIDSKSYDSSPGNGCSIGRLPDGSGNWTTFFLPTRGVSNDGSTSTPGVSPAPTPISYPTGVVLSEFMPDPGEGNEWVEIKNTFSTEAVLTDWQIDDIADGGSSPKKFSVIIGPNGYSKIDLGSSGFLNNSGDEVRLLYPNDSLVDKAFYSGSNTSVSWIKVEAIWCEAENATPGSANSPCRFYSDSESSGLIPTPTPTPTATPTPKVKKITPTPTGEIQDEEFEEGLYLIESPEPTPSPEVLGEAASKSRTLPKVLLGFGLVFLFIAGFWLWYNFGRDYQGKENFGRGRIGRLKTKESKDENGFIKKFIKSQKESETTD